MQQSVRTNLEEGNEIYFQELNNYICSYYVSSACPMPGAMKASLRISAPASRWQQPCARLGEGRAGGTGPLAVLRGVSRLLRQFRPPAPQAEEEMRRRGREHVGRGEEGGGKGRSGSGDDWQRGGEIQGRFQISGWGTRWLVVSH